MHCDNFKLACMVHLLDAPPPPPIPLLSESLSDPMMALAGGFFFLLLTSICSPSNLLPYFNLPHSLTPIPQVLKHT
jgi:hypothetical protein